MEHELMHTVWAVAMIDLMGGDVAWFAFYRHACIKATLTITNT